MVRRGRPKRYYTGDVVFLSVSNAGGGEREWICTYMTGQ